MLWLFLALTAAFSESLKNLFSKQGLSYLSPQFTALAATAFAFPILLIVFLLADETPTVGPRFWQSLLWGGTLNVLAFIQYMRALQDSDLSLAIPFMTLTPIFLLFTSPWFDGEFPSLLGVIGILLTVGGAYILSIQELYTHWFDPLLSIIKEPGPRRMLSVAMLYSLTSNFDKIGILHSSPLFWSLSLNLFMVCSLLCLYLSVCAPIKTSTQPTTLLTLIGIGFFSAVTLITHNMALSFASVPSVVAIKRTSILFTIIWGFIVLREKQIPQRFIGALLMVAGITLVAVAEDR